MDGERSNLPKYKLKIKVTLNKEVIDQTVKGRVKQVLITLILK